MKRLMLVGLAGGMFTVWAAGPFDKAVLHGETNLARAIDYAPNEEMTFILTLLNAGAFVKGEYFVQWTRTGDDGQTVKGRIDAKDLPLVVKTKIDRPGFVRLQAFVVDKTGKQYQKSFLGDRTTPEGQKAMNAFEKTDKRVFFDGGAGVQPEKLESVPEPVDFDAFWTRRRARLAKVPLEAEKREVKSPSKLVKAYAVSIKCAGPRPSTGYLTVPVKQGKYPVRISFHGYGHRFPNKGHVISPIAGDGKIIWFNFSPHGYELGREPEYYDEFYRSICCGESTFGFNGDQNRDPENCYFSGFTYRIMRALEWLKTLPEWDGKNLIVGGGSMGGMQSMWAIGLDKDVTEAYASIPWNCDIGGRDTMKRIVNPWYIRETPALRYYDPVNIVKRANPDCRVEVVRAGLGDYHCPPSGVSILYNNLPCVKKINWIQGSTHGYVPPEENCQKFSISERW